MNKSAILAIALLVCVSLSTSARADYVSYFDSQYGAGSEQFASVNNSNALVYSGTSTQIGGCFDKTWTSSYEGANGVMVLTNNNCLTNDDNESFSIGTSNLTVNDSKIIYFSMRWRANFTNPPVNSSVPTLKIQDLTTARLVYAKNNSGFPIDQWINISATFNIPIGHSYKAYLDFGNWVGIWNDTTLYVDSMNVGTVEMDRIDIIEPSIGDKNLLCNASTNFNTVDTPAPAIGVRNNSTFTLYVPDAFDHDIPCAVTWYNNLTSVRLPIASISGYSDSSYVGSWARSFAGDRGYSQILAFYRDYFLSFGFMYLDYHDCSQYPCVYYHPHANSIDLYYSLNSTYIERLNLYNSTGTGSCFVPHFAGDLDVRTNPDVHNIDVDRFASGIIAPSVVGAFFLPENWGSSIPCNWGGSGGSYFTALRPVPFPYQPSIHLCTPSWSCDPIAKQESYLSSTCSITQVHSCGDCGCSSNGLGGRCNVVPSHWTCNSGFENWHYNNLCQSDFAVFCDTGCVNDTCFGEVSCYDDTECHSTCNGSTLTPSLGCNLTSYSCTYGTPVVCANGCSLGACVGAGVTPIGSFTDFSSPQNVISDIKNGVFGFLGSFGNPFFTLMFLIIIGIVIISFFSLVLYAIKRSAH